MTFLNRAQRSRPFVYDPDPRRAWRQWVIVGARALQRREALGMDYAPYDVELPVFPEHCRGMTCGATTRRGTLCKRGDLYGPSGRCRLHGGLSTGPRTVEGKQRAAANGRCPKRKRTP